MTGDITEEERKKIILGICLFPGCSSIGTDWHHVIFRSQSRKKAIMEEWNGVRLCHFHHQEGAQAPHRSRVWREYYYRFLPKNWAKRIEDCGEIR